MLVQSLLLCLLPISLGCQQPFHTPSTGGVVDALDVRTASNNTKPPPGMELVSLAVSGDRKERVNLMFFGDGYTANERDRFLADAKKLTADIVSDGGAMVHVKDLLNVWGVFVPSNQSGLGHNKPLDGAPFGLYRDGAELRGVYPGHTAVARAACKYWREEAGEGGCDQPILLGNDGLYGGLGGEFTVITASELNGPLVLRHELGHSLINVGEEYEGGFAYFGVNSDEVANVKNLKWAKHLSDPSNVRVEDVKVPLQDYPWHNLDESDYDIKFTPSSVQDGDQYDTARLELSLSSIPYPSHVNLTLNGTEVDLTSAFPDNEWKGSLDRRWVSVILEGGIPASKEPITVHVSLTEEGRKAKAGQGGKMITSIEVVEYGADGRANLSPGFIGAFPTYSTEGNVTLRPMNEECVMRRVNHPTFCPVCAEELAAALQRTIDGKK